MPVMDSKGFAIEMGKFNTFEDFFMAKVGTMFFFFLKIIKGTFKKKMILELHWLKLFNQSKKHSLYDQ